MKKQGQDKTANPKSKKIGIGIGILALLVIVIVGICLWMVMTDKSYEVEEVGEHQYFKLYQQEQYGIIDRNGNIIIEPQ